MINNPVLILKLKKRVKIVLHAENKHTRLHRLGTKRSELVININEKGANTFTCIETERMSWS